jgi:hypothetical protein
MALRVVRFFKTRFPPLLRFRAYCCSVNKHGGYFMCWIQTKADGSVPLAWMKMALLYSGWKTVVLLCQYFF